MFSLYAIASTVVSVLAPATEAPVLEDDSADTQEVAVVTMHFTHLSTYPLHDMTQLLNCHVRYYHFDSTNELFTGRVIGIRDYHVVIQPDKREDMSLCQKTRHVTDITDYVHFE